MPVVSVEEAAGAGAAVEVAPRGAQEQQQHSVSGSAALTTPAAPQASPWETVG
jgi:hypothetical protein